MTLKETITWLETQINKTKLKLKGMERKLKTLKRTRKNPRPK